MHDQAPSGVGPMTSDESFPPAEGRAWLGEVAGSGGRSVRMWWSRTDGDLWLLTGHWYGAVPEPAPNTRDPWPQAGVLRRWALSIEAQPGDGGTVYELDDPGMPRLESDHAGPAPSRSRVWQYDGVEVVLLVIEHTRAAGWSNLLHLGEPEPVRVEGLDGWLVRARNGTVHVGWPVPGPGSAWAALTVPDRAAGDLGAILAALEPA
jgi:hypothetical protein